MGEKKGKEKAPKRGKKEKKKAKAKIKQSLRNSGWAWNDAMRSILSTTQTVSSLNGESVSLEVADGSRWIMPMSCVEKEPRRPGKVLAKKEPLKNVSVDLISDSDQDMPKVA